MTCEFCGESCEGRIRVSRYGGAIWICESCYQLTQKNYNKPYSKVMDKLAMLEAGYFVNRKLAKPYPS